MKKRVAAVILCGILSLTPASSYGSEIEIQTAGTGTDVFTSETSAESADVQETAEEEQSSGEDLFSDLSDDSSLESSGAEDTTSAEESDDAADEGALFTDEQEDTAEESTPSTDGQAQTDGESTPSTDGQAQTDEQSAAEQENISSAEDTEAVSEENILDADVLEDETQDDRITEALEEEQTESELTQAEVSAVGVDGSAVESGSLGETWKWNASSGKFTCYDSAGTQVSVADMVEKYTAAGSYYGFFEIGGRYYCLDDNGKPRTGEIQLTVNGTASTYYFQTEANSEGIPGEMFTGWRKVSAKKGDRWLYYDTGSSQAERGKLYEHGIIATKLDTSVMGSSLYLLDSDGYLLKSTMEKAANGSYYISNSKGVVYTKGLVTYKGSRYYVGKDGKRATYKNTWHRLKYAKNRFYYFGSTPGKIVKKTGWQSITVNGKFRGWYYFNKKGVHYVSRFLKNGRYITSTGRLASGPTKVGSTMYFFSVSKPKKLAGKMLKKQIVKYKGKYYYATSSGKLKKKGWVKVDGEYYYLKNYKMVTYTFITRKGVSGYLDGTGRFTTGWVIVDEEANKVKYMDVKKKKFVKNTTRVIDGLTYYFDKKGYRINDVSDKVSGPYSLVVDRVNGVITIYNKNKTIPVKSVRCSVGKASTPTVTGTYTLKRAGRWQLMMGNSWGQYASQITGNYLIHSVPMGTKNIHDVPSSYYYALGQPASHGCVRTNVADAKWIYENCNGSTITILDGTYQSKECFKGPLGRNAIVPMTTANTDPTDPAA